MKNKIAFIILLVFLIGCEKQRVEENIKESKNNNINEVNDEIEDSEKEEQKVIMKVTDFYEYYLEEPCNYIEGEILDGRYKGRQVLAYDPFNKHGENINKNDLIEIFISENEEEFKKSFWKKYNRSVNSFGCSRGANLFYRQDIFPYFLKKVKDSIYGIEIKREVEERLFLNIKENINQGKILKSIEFGDNLKIPEWIYKDQLNNYFKLGNINFVTFRGSVAGQPSKTPEPKKYNLNGILYAYEGDNEWKVFVYTNQGNVPLNIWINDEDELILPVVDGAGYSGEGHLKILYSRDFGKSWEVKKCFSVFGIHPDIALKREEFQELYQNYSLMENDEQLEDKAYIIEKYRLDKTTGEFELDSNVEEKMLIQNCSNVEIY